jgi:hypothetical protein
VLSWFENPESEAKGVFHDRRYRVDGDSWQNQVFSRKGHCGTLRELCPIHGVSIMIPAKIARSR